MIETRQFSNVLQENRKKATENNIESFAQEHLLAQKRGPVKNFIYKLCPIGLWNLFRRLKCFLKKEPYVEPIVKRTVFKSVIRNCMPRFLWDQLRKAKCKENNWVFVDEM